MSREAPSLCAHRVNSICNFPMAEKRLVFFLYTSIFFCAYLIIATESALLTFGGLRRDSNAKETQAKTMQDDSTYSHKNYMRRATLQWCHKWNMRDFAKNMSCQYWVYIAKLGNFFAHSTQHNFSFASPKQLTERVAWTFRSLKVWSGLTDDAHSSHRVWCLCFNRKRSWKFNPFSTEIWFLSMSMDIKLPDFIESYIVYHAAAGVSACHDWKFFQSSKKCMSYICQSASEWMFPRNAIISFRFSSLPPPLRHSLRYNKQNFSEKCWEFGPLFVRQIHTKYNIEKKMRKYTNVMEESCLIIYITSTEKKNY